MRLTEDQLDELARLEKAATPPGWRQGVEIDEETGEEIGSLSIHGPDYEQEWSGETHTVCDTVAVLGFSAHKRHKHNMALITALRNAAPSLIEEVRELRKDKERLEALFVALGSIGQSDLIDRVTIALQDYRDPRPVIDAAMKESQ